MNINNLKEMYQIELIGKGKENYEEEEKSMSQNRPKSPMKIESCLAKDLPREFWGRIEVASVDERQFSKNDESVDFEYSF